MFAFAIKTRGLIGLIDIAGYSGLPPLVSGTGVHSLTASYIDDGYHLMPMGGTQLGSGHNPYYVRSILNVAETAFEICPLRF